MPENMILGDADKPRAEQKVGEDVKE